MSKFQIILLCVFAILGVGGLISFSAYRGAQSQAGLPPVVIWGTVDGGHVGNYIGSIFQDPKIPSHISYVQKSEATLYQDFIEALASGQGPDALLLAQDNAYRYQGRLLAIPYDNMPELTFKNSFVQGAEIYLMQEGVMALPLAVDPLVMYWNRDMFNNAGITQPPTSWEEFLTLVPRMTEKDAAHNIIKSGVALGEARNIINSKEILSMLIMQSGNPITVRADGSVVSILDQGLQRSTPPGIAALTFYTQFADPVKQVYSWNRALQDSKNMFIGNRLAVYFGFASELPEIRRKNPNLNFEVAFVPQVKAQAGVQTNKMTYGRIYGFSLVANRPNVLNTLSALQLLTSQEHIQKWSTISGLPSIRRDAILNTPNNASMTIFSQSAFYARGWIDPDKIRTTSIFRDMVENVTSGRFIHSEAVREANNQINSLLRNVR